jgi:hypothetical protein
MRSDTGTPNSQAIPYFIALTSAGLLRALYVGRAESGQRREEGPPSGRIRVGLDSYVDLDNSTMGGPASGFKAIRQLIRQYCSEEHSIQLSVRVFDCFSVMATLGCLLSTSQRKAIRLSSTNLWAIGENRCQLRSRRELIRSGVIDRG